MSLRFVRVKVPRFDSQDILHITTTVAALTQELSSMSFFPPATAAVSILLLILQTVQSIQNNKEACFRLVRRSARILLDINEQMEGRWDTASPTLIRNLEKFQDTLRSIHEFMKSLTDASWVQRFTKKTTIENAIIDYTGQLLDAAQSFQIATLIDIHYAVSDRAKERTILDPSAPPPYQSPVDSIQCSNESLSSVSESRSNSLILVESPVDIKENWVPLLSPEKEDEIISDAAFDARGFRRYHQSEVRFRGRVNLKGGWWAGTSPAEVEGRPALIKRYEGPAEQALKVWMKDVKLLQNVFHPNLPQMVGLSEGGAPTPFIVLSHVQRRTPQALLLDVLRKEGLAACTNLILHFYQDVVDAALYIQRQRGLEDRELQDFVGDASFRVDGSNTMIMGLPAPRCRHWRTARNYGLTESLKMVVMNMLPNEGVIQYKPREVSIENRDTSRHFNHLITLTKGLLPAEKAPIKLSSRVQVFIDNDDDEEEEDDLFSSRMPRKPRLTLRQLRLSNIDADTHNHTWKENGGIPSHKFAIGDYGYIPVGGKGFQDFIVLGNILKDGLVKFAIDNHAYGTHWNWKDTPIRHEPMEPFPLPGDATCWTLVVLPYAQADCQIIHSSSFARVADAWRFLLLHGKDLAVKHNVRPEELVLITQAGTNQDFYIRDFNTQPPLAPRPQALNRHPVHQLFGFNNLNNSAHMFQPRSPFPNNPPAIMYLITSPTPHFEPYWTHSPVVVPQGVMRPALNRGWTYKIGWSTGFIDWIQLHPEDFDDC